MKLIKAFIKEHPFGKADKRLSTVGLALSARIMLRE